MSSRIEQLIDELEEYIESCKPKFMSSSEIIVNKEAILNDARAKAQALIDEATVHTNELISEHEIMQQAYEQANGIVAQAAGQAQEILDKATMEANELRMQAAKYTEDRLAELESIVASAIQSSSANYDRLIGSLGQYRDLIQSNLRALRPSDEDLDGQVDGSGIDVI